MVWAGTWGGGLSRYDGKAWTQYTVSEGLPGNHVFMLHIDPKGVMWIGTNNGLARFDPRTGAVRTFDRERRVWTDSWMGARDGVLQPLLRQWTLPAQEIHAVFSSPRLVPTKVSGFVDFLLPHFGGDWWAGAATSQPAS